MDDKINNVLSIMNVEFEDLFKTIINTTHEYIFFKDRNSKFIYLNNALLNAYNADKLEDAIGKSDYEYYPKEFADIKFAQEQNIMHTGKPLLDKEERLVQANGQITWYKVSKYPLYCENGSLVGLWGISTNITYLKNIELQLEEANMKLIESRNAYQIKSEIDQATGLKNKRKMLDDISLELSKYTQYKRREDAFCIAFIDIDNFKQINDTFGHNCGDFVLKQTGTLLERVVRMRDNVYRYGGDEFVVFYKGINLEQSKRTTQRIVDIIASHTFQFEDKEIKVTISVGVAVCSETQDVDMIIKLADARLYRAKKAGKNTVM